MTTQRIRAAERDPEPVAPALAGTAGRVLPRSFYRRDPRLAAPDLLNKVLLRSDGRSGRIVEVEAYHGDLDAAAHSFRGRTPRNATMFGPPGHLYVYFTYGMHWCCNPVCGEEGEGMAVLLRALRPLTGFDLMRARRPSSRTERDLCRGPARLCQAFDITLANDGIDLTRHDSGLVIVDDGTPPPRKPMVTPRIGISKAKDLPWRWLVDGEACVSR